MNFFLNLIKVIINTLFAFSKFFITIYGGFLKFFLQLNGGYWGKIGIGKYSTIEKKRFYFVLPLYILLALLFGFFSIVYWYFILLFIPIWIERYFVDTAQWNNYIVSIMAISILFGWFFILCKTK